MSQRRFCVRTMQGALLVAACVVAVVGGTASASATASARGASAGGWSGGGPGRLWPILERFTGESHGSFSNHPAGYDGPGMATIAVGGTRLAWR